MWSRFEPKETLSAAETETGLRAIVRDGLCSQAMGALTTGVFLVGFVVSQRY